MTFGCVRVDPNTKHATKKQNTKKKKRRKGQISRRTAVNVRCPYGQLHFPAFTSDVLNKLESHLKPDVESIDGFVEALNLPFSPSKNIQYYNGCTHTHTVFIAPQACNNP